MSRRILISVSAIFILVVGSIKIVRAYTVLDTAAAIRAEGQIPFTPQALLDNFNTQVTTNAWNCVTGTFSKSEVVPIPVNEKCAASYSADTPDGTGYSLKLDYNVSQTSSYDGKPTYAGYYSQLGGVSLTSLGTPPISCTAVSFWVKGTPGVLFKIQLSNNSTKRYDVKDSNNQVLYTYKCDIASIYVNDYLDSGVTGTWQKVTIPLYNFANLYDFPNLYDFSSMKEFVIVFENAQSAANGSPTSGTVYIDDIAFETGAVNTVRIAHFGEAVYVDPSGKKGICSLGGNIGTAVKEVDGKAIATINNELSGAVNEYPPLSYPYGLKITYDVTASGAFAATYFIIGGGNDSRLPDINQTPTDKDGWTAIPHNFTAYGYMTFKIRAKSETENPGGINVQIVDSDSTKTTPISGIRSDAWTKYAVLLHSTGAASIKQITFVFDDWWIDNYANQGDKAGTVFIDEVQFQKTIP